MTNTDDKITWPGLKQDLQYLITLWRNRATEMQSHDRPIGDNENADELEHDIELLEELL